MDLFEKFMANPLEAIVALLCISSISLQLGLFEAETAYAVMKKDVEANTELREVVFEMHNMIIRIDENVKHIKKEAL